MSLLETAKRHQLNSEKYLSYLLECLPNEETLVNQEVLEAYLPWTIKVENREGSSWKKIENHSTTECYN
ncbi:transposase [Streptococcus pneumoniae]|nr:transposase [Streptococcus pneumoniae]